MLCIQCFEVAMQDCYTPDNIVSKLQSKSRKAIAHPVLDVKFAGRCTWRFLMATEAELLF